MNRNIVPGFYRYLQAQEQQKQVELAEELRIEVGIRAPFLPSLYYQFYPFLARVIGI